MKNNIFLPAFLAVTGVFQVSCSDGEDPVLTVKDWDGTATYFASSDNDRQNLYYKPAVGYVGDPMPFYDEKSGEFKILYLQEYRPNAAGTYHPFWGVSTKNGASYTSLGEVIPTGTTAEQDAALGTGSTIYHNGIYYTFYTAHANSSAVTGYGEAVMLATSADFVNWTKDRSFLLTADGYSSDDFRDPFVFKGDDNLFHMVVSTKKDGKGVLAEYTSTDLRDWTSAGVFMTMMWDRFYECPDVFKMGDWWYLVYSEMHAAVRRVQYFKGRTLAELKACTANDAGLWPDSHEGMLDSRGLYAGKTASDGVNRYLWGWCPTRTGLDNTNVGAYPNEPEWAGALVCHRVVQHADGTLSLGKVDAIDARFAKVAPRIAAHSESGFSQNGETIELTGDAYVMFGRLNTENRLSFTVTTSGDSDRFGFSFARGTDSEKYYTVMVNPENSTTRKINFEEEGPKGIGFVNGIDGYPFPTPSDNTYNVTIYTDNSVMTVYINDNVAYTNRIYGVQRNCWSINSYGGNVRINNLAVSR